MTNEDAKLREFLKGAGDLPPCPTGKFVNSFLAEMDNSQTQNKVKPNFSGFMRMAAAFALVAIGIGAWYFNDNNAPNNARSIALASINAPESVSEDLVSETLIYGDKTEDAFAASLVGSDDISTLVSISDP